MVNRFRKYGDLRPTAIGVGDTLRLHVLLVLALLARALDYSSTGGDPSAVLEYVLPMPIWAIWCLISAALLAYSLIRGWHFGVYLGHAVTTVLMTGIGLSYLGYSFESWPPAAAIVDLSITYPLWLISMALLALSALVPAIIVRRKGGRPFRPMVIAVLLSAVFMALLHPYPADGLRAAASVGVQGYLHVLLMYRTGRRPVNMDKVCVEETVVQER